MDSTQVLVVTIVVVLLVMIVSAVVTFHLRSSLYLKMSESIERGDFASFFRMAEGRASRMLVSPYARGLLVFKAYAAQGDRTRMVEQFNLLMKLKLSDFTKASLLTEGFAAFAAVRDRKHCKRIIEGMEKVHANEESLRAHRQYYDIVLDHKTSELDRIEQMLPSLTGRRRGYAEYLLAAMHATRKDGREAECRELAARDLKVSPAGLDGSVRVSAPL